MSPRRAAALASSGHRRLALPVWRGSRPAPPVRSGLGASVRAVRLGEDDARARLGRADHGVFCTVHARRGVDAVPVVFVLEADDVGIPVDRVKPKASVRLQRERNLEADPRATLVVDHWDHDDWSQLWWVRAELRWHPDPRPELVAALSDRLARRHAQYRNHPFERVLVLQLAAISGWAAGS
jgi:hypothetical protein